MHFLSVYNCPMYVQSKIDEKKEHAMRMMQEMIKKSKLNTTPKLFFLKNHINQRSNTMQDTDMQEALKDVTADDDKDAIFVEVLNLRAYVNRLLSRVKNLESKE